MNPQFQHFPRINRLAGSLAWLGAALVVLIVTFLATVRVGRIGGDEVGVLLNKWTEKTEIISQSGQKFYISLTHRLYVLDKTLQTLEMTVEPNRGERQGKDDIKVKTVDGSDVYIDVIVQYKISPAKADLVLRTSGPGDAFKSKWARDYIRTLVRNHIGELTTEKFYDARERDAKVNLALQAAVKKLEEPFGISVTSIIIPTRPRFYDQYEAMIKKKKLADQQALQEESKAEAAKQRQKTETVEANNLKNVAVEEFKGKMEQKVIEAKAECERMQKEADAYFSKISIGAEAQLYERQKAAEGILATKTAEAAGLEALGKALEGEGGRNMVKLEYARRLKDTTIKGQPYVTDSQTRRFSLSNTGDPLPTKKGGK